MTRTTDWTGGYQTPKCVTQCFILRGTIPAIVSYICCFVELCSRFSCCLCDRFAIKRCLKIGIRKKCPLSLLSGWAQFQYNIHFDQLNHNFDDILFMSRSIIIINYNITPPGCSARCEPNSRLGGIYSNFDTLWVYADRSGPKIDTLICNACVVKN